MSKRSRRFCIVTFNVQRSTFNAQRSTSKEIQHLHPSNLIFAPAPHHIKKVTAPACFIMSTAVETSLIFDRRIVRDLTRALPRRSLVSSLLLGWWSHPAAHPPASPHGVFSTSLRFGRNDSGRLYLPRQRELPLPAVFLSCRPEWRHLSLFDLTIVRDLTRAGRSPVSSLLPGWWSRPAAHPPASPHGAFSTSLRLGRNDRAHRTSNIEYLAPTITMRL